MKSLEFRKKYGEGTDFDPDYGKLATFLAPLCVHCYTGVPMFG